MKIETKKQEFQPIVITLETQEEVDQMFAISNYTEFTGDGGLDITQKIYDYLINFVEERFEFQVRDE